MYDNLEKIKVNVESCVILFINMSIEDIYNFMIQIDLVISKM